jgi:tetratricopeptide (TPR) repeat protein
MVRLAAVLAQSGDQRESVEQYRAAERLAPNRRDVREALVRQLVRMGEYSGAIEQCEQLAERHAQDADVLRMLGQLYLDAATPADRKEAEAKAIETWKRIAALRPQDPASAVQVAAACRRAAGISDRRSSGWLELSLRSPGEFESTGVSRTQPVGRTGCTRRRACVLLFRRLRDAATHRDLYQRNRPARLDVDVRPFSSSSVLKSSCRHGASITSSCKSPTTATVSSGHS